VVRYKLDQEAMMTLNQFRQALTKVPFRPFQMVLADGRSFTIEHPEFAAMDPRGREVTFYQEDGTQHFVDAILIAEVVIPPAPETSRAT
jgi:hypothetical protein